MIKDENKTKQLESQDLTVVRFTDNEVMDNLEGVMYHLEKYLNPE